MQCFSQRLRTKLSTKDSFTYPDVIIVCGKPELLDEHFDTLLNPSVIIEVLSPSTEKYDRGIKFFFYLQMPSLKEYIMVSSTGVNIHHSHRQSDGSWKFEEIMDGGASFYINTIEYEMTLADVYDEVSW